MRDACAVQDRFSFESEVVDLNKPCEKIWPKILRKICVLSLLTTVLGEGSEFELKLNCIQQLYFSWRFFMKMR